ncbi:hypothetical protein HPB47_005868 [Ixodes persulcatus]|uniref:Uncharacterized protein n=1 Tax=Ixodes persulcatus TaxID=34615 RepID=A0AC60PBT9_IXOPE|nr:hypothetical protein HPB47_005868 [Ixodes persulcatus]
MPPINWAEAAADDLAGFTVDFLRNELLRPNLEVTGTKEDIIHRLLADIAQNRPPTPPALLLPNPATSARFSQESLPLQTLDPAQSTQRLTSLLQQLLNMSQRPMAPVQWQRKVTSRLQLRGESLVDYSLAKLKLISKYPVVLTDVRRIKDGEEEPPSTSSSLRGHIQQPRRIDDHEESTVQENQDWLKDGWDGVLDHYRAERRAYPEAQSTLSKAKFTILRQVQTETFLNPAQLHTWYSVTYDPSCRNCGEIATLHHILWGCPELLLHSKNKDFIKHARPPGAWESFLRDPDPNTKKILVQLASDAAGNIAFRLSIEGIALSRVSP